MTNQIYKLPIKTLRAFMKDVFLKLGVPKKDAETCADVLISADLRGIDSHGIQRLKMYYNWIKSGILLPKTKLTVVRETPTTLLINGNNGMGQVIAYHSMQMVIEKAKRHGIAAAAVFNSNHYGIAGYYALMAVKEGLIGLAMTNARPAVAPTFGVEPIFGTNAIAFGAPTGQSCPFLFDTATSLLYSWRERVDDGENPQKGRSAD